MTQGKILLWLFFNFWDYNYIILPFHFLPQSNPIPLSLLLETYCLLSHTHTYTTRWTGCCESREARDPWQGKRLLKWNLANCPQRGPGSFSYGFTAEPSILQRGKTEAGGLPRVWQQALASCVHHRQLGLQSETMSQKTKTAKLNRTGNPVN